MTAHALTRRQLLQWSGMGLGSVALAWLQGQNVKAAPGGEKARAFDLLPKRPPNPARARSIILLMQNGGPSQMDLFDPKPDLKKYNGRQHSIKVEMFQVGSEQNKLLDTPFQFRRYGKAGTLMSEVIPHLGSVADELCLIRSMHTGHNNHTEGLIRDLKQRGLLDTTIVIWSGEFGRLPVSQNGTGRDHNRNAFSLLAAGGGFKPGFVHGETDEVGYAAAVNRVSVADFHATLLHQLGLDHETLSFNHSGRDETLTDAPLTKARVVEEVLQ